ncbi:DNA-binding transcription repressor ASH1 CYBJADRAFT_162779 [Cyberlindnera jadinii NRRL Y-1542]|uniref:GATA-type domain-containing protein n=1 Tax=Cyberlindnera jadinii (strain ATCC 18201 / CBS 1600 / BCRC 20928 / JCM 3617 / NBRC 0987 / NRRL Y-1542) TaxID=983966 RepID=A0A1E4S1M1_CYBJN|nr:hypothetical protein CYBJADRAFT_162779 [Cyberlindnera jadinii NRRL Y-1542]ODV73405.1 hypothetical protein CYBJADRAFT_162779 [Cyberlindnera jadinii NRRL Y-1542]
MNTVFPQLSHGMQGNIFQSVLPPTSPSSASSDSLKRKRYLDDLDILEQSNKRCKTAPPTPPLAAVFTRGRSASPVSSHATLLPLPVSPLMGQPLSLATPKTPSATLAQAQLAEPVQIKKASPVLSVPTVIPVGSSPSTVKLPSFKYLTQNDRYSTTGSLYAMDYPDTCVNDDDWRLHLEVWIERNFPEMFHKLKNFLRYDKPGFELLNDAIFLTELKEQLEKVKRVPCFNSKISKKMVTKKVNPYYKSFSDHSGSGDNKPTMTRWTQSSPIAPQPVLVTEPKSPLENNYVYSVQTPMSSPISTTTQQISPSSKRWSGHHKLNEQVVLKTNDFIHTQNHKGPNHSYTIHHHHQNKRKCISCGSDQSPCWRPSWSTSAGQLCNSCGLRYKKTGARCISKSCCRIPAKGEWATMKARGKKTFTKEDGSVVQAYACLNCNGEVEVKDK